MDWKTVLSHLKVRGIWKGNRIIKLLPNDLHIEKTIRFRKSGSWFKIEVFNVFGQLLYEDNLEKVSGYFEKSVSVGNFPAGVYTIQLSSEEGDVSRMIVLE